MKRCNQGYILLEAMVAMVVLSLGAVMVHSVLRQGVLTRGQAQDYASVQFLMDGLMADIELRPALQAESRSGAFDEYDGRFTYRYTIRKVAVPYPKPTPSSNPKKRPRGIPPDRSFMVHVRADILWSRGGVPFRVSREMLYGPDRYFQPAEGT